MGKVNTRARVETLRVWLEDVKKGKSKPVTVQLKESSKGTTVTIEGSMKINTLDWPLRSKVTAKDVNVDQITVQLHLTFKK